jgi:2,3-bisphosphoglycerate-independent phosphoglycerate mutase
MGGLLPSLPFYLKKVKILNQGKKMGPVMLMILDGFGNNPKTDGNAISKAHKPNWDALFEKYPHTTLKTSGLDVGLPEGQMGNSEVGHTNIGAGRVVYQELTRITKSIQDGDFFEKTEFIEALEHCKKNGSKLHLCGLLSDGGVHSHNTHLYALLSLAKQKGLKDVYVHCFLDGRDVSPDSGNKYLEELLLKMEELGVGKVCTIMGRYYAMDRDNRWERVQLAYDAMALGTGSRSTDPLATMEERYAKKEFDEFIKPTVLIQNDEPVATISEQDSVIFYNFRPDRAREITRAFVDEDFTGFERAKGFFKVHYACMTQYDKHMPNVTVAYKPQGLAHTFGEYVSAKGLTQFRIAETEKYAHVTFFFNGGTEAVYPGEERCLVPSPKVPTYDLKPEMSAFEVTDEVISRIQEDRYDVFILNYANPDMVGHTGNFDAAKDAIEAVDLCLGKVVSAILAKDGVVLLTADHGNAEQMVDYETGGPFTAHTVNDVPLVAVGLGEVSLKQGRLADLAPTLLKILNLEKPQEMTGEALF